MYGNKFMINDPRALRESTISIVNGYPACRRTNNKFIIIMVIDVQTHIDNSWIVPYKPYKGKAVPLQAMEAPGGEDV
jgi:hypothetical protein